PAEVTLRRPPPLGRPLAVERRDGRVELLDGTELVAEGIGAAVELEVPAPVSVADAERASESFPGFERHAFPTCFVCGPEREPGQGLRIFAGPVAGREVVAAPWTPAADLADEDELVRAEYVWASLDCPGAIAVGWPDRGDTVLGRLAARVDRVPRAGERCVVVGWQLGEEGRKLWAGTALFGDGGDLLALGRATWIAPR
ncbi:MAG: hypothetical protein ACRDN6_08680, partial [Gaiellaceae bacterium]